MAELADEPGHPRCYLTPFRNPNRDLIFFANVIFLGNEITTSRGIKTGQDMMGAGQLCTAVSLATGEFRSLPQRKTSILHVIIFSGRLHHTPFEMGSTAGDPCRPPVVAIITRDNHSQCQQSR